MSVSNFSKGLSEELPLMGYIDARWLDSAAIFTNGHYNGLKGLFFTLHQVSLVEEDAYRDVKVLCIEENHGHIDTLCKWFTPERHSITGLALAQRKEIIHPFGDAKFDYWANNLCFVKDSTGDRLVLPLLRYVSANSAPKPRRKVKDVAIMKGTH